MAEKILVSLLMPVFNVEKYLPEALDSALGQTLENIEIICIDDGSSDRSGQILDAYAARDARIRVKHRANSGYGSAMNLGLDLARGKYIAILEPDDFLDKHMLTDLYQIAEKYQLDFVKSDFAMVEGVPGAYQISPTHVYWQMEMYGKVLSRQEKKELFRGYLAHWSCLYRRSFLEKNHIRFNVTAGASYQDTGFWFLTMALSERIYLHDGCYYHYRQDNPEASQWSRDKIYCITDEYEFIYKQLSERGMLLDYWPQFVTFSFIGHRDTLYRLSSDHRAEFIRHIASWFGRLEKEGRLDTSFMDVTDKAMLEEILCSPESFCDKIVAIPEFIHGMLKLYDDFYIYGAGTRAKRIYRYLSGEDRKNFLGYLITEAGEVRRLFGQPVMAVSEVKVGMRTGVIIGVTDRYRREIVEELQRRGIETAIVLPEENVP